MKKVPIIMCLWISVATIARAQNDWQDGYLIQMNGNTIHGFVDKRDSRSNSQKCYFKTSLDSEPEVFLPTDLYGYRFGNGKYYISKTVKDIDPDNPVFLEYIVKAEASLYHYRDSESHFFIEKDSMLYELVNTESDIEQNDAIYRTNNSEYIGVLTYLLRDADIGGAIQHTELNTKSLTKLANKYHNVVCSDEECIIYERKPDKAKLHLSVYGGVSFDRINFGDAVESNYGLSYLAGVKTDLEHIFNWLENLYISTGLEIQYRSNYSLHNMQADQTEYITYNNETYRLSNDDYSFTTESLDVEINTWLLKIPITFNYYLAKGNVKPYLGGGLLSMFTLSQNKDFIYQSFNGLYEQSIPTFHFGYMINAGAQYKINKKQSLFTELSFESTQTTQVNEILRFNHHAFIFKCGYRF